MHDALTGLYNRTYFNEELRRLRASRQFPVSVIMMDVDGLKCANDVHGHATGDRLLQSVGEVLRGAFRAEDMVARIGGDEFAALMPNASQAAAEAKLQQIRDTIAGQQFDLPDDFPLSISMEYAVAAHAGALDESQQMADEMMYRAKAEHHQRLSHQR
jgi:diguanylate cyclase (GGDEF)-like protein